MEASAHASSFQEGIHVMKELTGCGLTWLVRDSLLKETVFLSGSETHLGAFEGGKTQVKRPAGIVSCRKESGGSMEVREVLGS